GSPSSYDSVDIQDPHSFPTRRSSDLIDHRARQGQTLHAKLAASDLHASSGAPRLAPGLDDADPPGMRARPRFQIDAEQCRVASRSEEHTSELQSPCKLVCRLLLEKKK